MGHGPLVGGHSWSPDGIRWSNLTQAYNTTRPLATGQLGHVSYAAERPKLLFDKEDGVTPTHLYTASSKGTGYTIVSPLRAHL